MRIGSVEHLTLFCGAFIDTHRRFDPETLPWPDLDASSVAKLRALPFWDEAIRTERRTGAKVLAYAALESPPLLRAAVELQGYEETRHARLLDALVARYGIVADPGREQPLPKNLEAAFMRTGYGECIDSFFAFGLFAVAREAAFLPDTLLDLLEPIVEEEVRHILFLVNWVAYKRLQQPPLLRPVHRWRCLTSFAGAAYDRVRSAAAAARGSAKTRGDGVTATGGEAPARVHTVITPGDGFTASGAAAITPDLSPRRFVARCLEENDRRFRSYDPRLLRPRVVPWFARAYLTVTGGGTRRMPASAEQLS